MDDFTFGTAVWQDTSPEQHPIPFDEPSTSTLPIEKKDPVYLETPSDASTTDGFDEFHDFPSEADAPAAGDDDDDFGDFGDFGDADDGNTLGGFEDAVEFPSSSTIPATFEPTVFDWRPLQLDPLPSSTQLLEQVNELLGSLWEHIDPKQTMTDEPIRQVEGLGQILSTPESRNLYQTLLVSSPPSLPPPNWTTSRIRRQHLISLGIPINLDEVLPRSMASPLPALQLTTRPSSAPPGPRPSRPGTPSLGNGPPQRSGTPVPTSNATTSSRLPQHSSHLGLGPKPTIDRKKIDDLLALTPDALTLLPLATLTAHLTSLTSLTSDTSSLLSHLLQVRDALQQDSETYHGLIADLVGEAQKLKGGPSGLRKGKRGSGAV